MSSSSSSTPPPPLKRGRIVPPPPSRPALKSPHLQEDILIQQLILPAPCALHGAIVCDSFLYCPSPIGQSSLLHSVSHVSNIPSTRPAVLCFHGGGQNRHTWRNTACALSRTLDALVITVDLRGHGESFWGEEYSARQFGQDIDYLIQVLGILRPNGGRTLPRRYALVGASQGGIGLIYSDSVSNAAAVVLVDISPRIERLGVERIIGFMAPTSQTGFASVKEAVDVIHKYTPHRARPEEEGVKRNLRQEKNTGRYYWRWDPMFIFSRIGLDFEDHHLTGPIFMNLEEQKIAMKTFIQMIEADAPMCFAAASRIKCPALLVRADSSDVLTQTGIDEFKVLVPQAESVDVTGASHMVISDAADIFSTTIVGWLESAFKKEYELQTLKQILRKSKL